MPNYVYVSRENHGAKRWKRPKDYKFAASQIAVPVVAGELPQAMLSLPIGFIEQGDGCALAAILGIKTGENLMVLPDGRWLGPYLPAAFRAYPFVLHPTEQGREALCIAEDSGLIVGDAGGHLFFDADGEPSKEMSEVIAFLQRLSADNRTTTKICDTLKAHGLIEAWPIAVQGDNTDNRELTGLYRINELALNRLPVESLAEIRDCGGLVVAYAQLLSMNRIQTLAQLASARMAAQGAMSRLPVTPAGELDLEFLNQSSSLDYGKLG